MKKSTKYLSSGSTLLNLMLTGSVEGAFKPGHYYYLVGDSNSGKTFFSMTCLAEAINHPVYKNYDFIFDDVEGGCLFDMDRLFGKGVAKKTKPPSTESSSTIEDFYFNIDKKIRSSKETKKPFIYILDSMDALDSVDSRELFEKQRKQHEEGKALSGSYGDGKAKKNSQNIRRVIQGLQKTKSILIIISQVRDNLGFGFETKVHTSGKSMDFYATVTIWTTRAGWIKKTVKGKERRVGTHIRLDTKKNRITGKSHSCFVDIFPSYGIDDIGACVDFLCEEKWWKTGKKIESNWDDCPGLSREGLIKHIETNNLINRLKKEVQACWDSIEDACACDRIPRYAEV